MSVTEETRTSAARGRARPSSRAGAADGAGASVVAPPSLRRRPLVVVLSVLAVCVGALVSAYAYSSTSTAREVLAVTSTVHRGERVEPGDVAVVRVGVDPALRPVPGDQLGQVVGQRAAVDLPAGGLVTDGAVAVEVVPGRGLSVVGVALAPSALPGEPLQAGDRVRVVATPGDQGEVPSGEQRTVAATVVGVRPGSDTEMTVVDVELPSSDAAELAARAATGRVALVLDSRER